MKPDCRASSRLTSEFDVHGRAKIRGDIDEGFNFLRKLHTLMIANAIAGSAGTHGARPITDESTLGADTTRFVVAPLDIMLSHFFRAKRTAQMLPQAKRLWSKRFMRHVMHTGSLQKARSQQKMVWASRWSVALRTFYNRQILSLVYSSFPFETSTPGSPGNYLYIRLTLFLFQIL